MQILPIVFAVVAVSFQSLGSTRRSDPLLVRAVIDGDTIDVSTVGRVRLLGIDAPEIGRGFDTSAPFGREARDKLVSLVFHRWIRLEEEGPAVDVYNRRLAYVMTEDGVFVNEALVRTGLARVSARSPLSRLADLNRAQAEAQAFRRGMWGATPVIPTPSYTRPRPRKKTPKAKSTTRGPRPRNGRHFR